MTTLNGDHSHAVADECLRFFGEMSASISHEIRNKLAVINEKAGLLQDMAVMMQSGREIDPDRMELQAKKIAEQIRHANRIVGVLNRLAHSVDDTHAGIDLTELVDLAAALHHRKASMAEVVIDPLESTEAVPVATDPFLLENLISVCFDIAIPRVDDSHTLTIATERIDDGGIVRFQHLERVDDFDLRFGARNSAIGTISTILGASLATSNHRRDLVLTIRNLESHDSGSQP
jgi:C4-dicarboxylate-specific signal transduction histidine kinase